MSGLDILLGAAFLTVMGGTSALAFLLALIPIVPRPVLGGRGSARARALRRGGLFPRIEPVLRVLATWLSFLPADRPRRALHGYLMRAGDYLGLSEDELLALCTLCGLWLAVVTAFACALLELASAFVAVAFVLGSAAPFFRLVVVARARATRVNRGLPAAVDLAAMCMGAGLDFPGSLRRIVESATDPNEPIIEEFSRVLQELELGHTRRSAMQGFERRVPTDQVRELVNSVTQAEEKGSPLASVLTIQAQTQRLRRSIAAEQTASEAALMLLGPMTLIFLCVIVLLLGPVAVRFLTGGIAPA